MKSKLFTQYCVFLVILCSNNYVHSNIVVSQKCQLFLSQHPTFAVHGNTFLLESEIQSKTALHLRFSHLYHQTSVLNSSITFHFTLGANEFRVDDFLLPSVDIEPKPWTKDQFIWNEKGKNFYVVQKLFGGKMSDHDSVSIQSLDGKFVKHFSAFCFFRNPDTTLMLPVFNPNPVESSGRFYGFPLLDNKDKSHEFMDDQYHLVQLPMVNSSDKYQPQVSHIHFSEISAPDDDAHLISLNSLPKNRSHIHFELANVAYHLNAFTNYIVQLGYDQLLDSLQIDVHGLSGADQSAFNRFKIPATIEFGQGGVDDAEDGQVVVHEFVHSIANKAYPMSLEESERIPMEEGFADYLAMSYSNRITNRQSTDVFSWDGHNEFWSGFTMNTVKTYVANNDNQKVNREIWSASINCIAQKIGHKVADELVFEQLFYLNPNATLPKAAKNMLWIDSILNDGSSKTSIKQCFIQSGILETDAMDVDFSDYLSHQVRLINNNASNNADEKLTIIFNKEMEFDYSILDVTGRLVYTQNTKSRSLSIAKNHFTPGVYLLQIIPKNSGYGLRESLEFKVMF